MLNTNTVLTNNLFQRILTALIAIPFVLFLIIKSSPAVFFILTIGLLSICIHEWAVLFSLKNFIKIVFLFIYLILFCIFYSLINFNNFNNILSFFLIFITIFWICCLAIIILYNLKLYNKQSVILSELVTHSLYNKIISFFLGFFIILPGFMFLNFLKTKSQNSSVLIIVLLALVWAVDTGSYFFGKFFGKHKLIPHVSPGKTIEGAIGGLICLFILSLIFYYNLAVINNTVKLSSWLYLSFFIYLFSIIGDLSISVIKRIVLVKDTGNLLPGHGGILDRLDSFFSTMPIYFYFLFVFNII